MASLLDHFRLGRQQTGQLFQLTRAGLQPHPRLGDGDRLISAGTLVLVNRFIQQCLSSLHISLQTLNRLFLPGRHIIDRHLSLVGAVSDCPLQRLLLLTIATKSLITIYH